MKSIISSIKNDKTSVRNTHCIDKECLHAGSNRRPSVYKTDALPLSYKGSTVADMDYSVLTQLRPKATGDRTQYSEFSSLIAAIRRKFRMDKESCNKINRRDDVAGSDSRRAMFALLLVVLKTIRPSVYETDALPLSYKGSTVADMD
uniref:Uncharacterized protein n=1 Tax=Heterorhabditis bacteriophora TaxID=37862 RepID=A0A1I7WDE7_HETBA